MSNLKRLFTYTKPYSKQLIVSIVAASLFGIVSAAPAYFLRQTIDEIFIKRYSHLIVPFIFIFVFIFVLKGILMYVSCYWMHWVNHKVINDLRNDMYKHTVQLPVSFFQNSSTGALMSRFLNDVQMIQQAGASAIKDGLRSIFEAAFLVSYALYQNVQLAGLMIILGPLLGIIISRLGKARKKASTSIQQQLGFISNMLQESFVGIREIKAFNGEKLEANRFKKLLALCFDAIMRNVHIEVFLPAVIEALAIAGCSVIFYVAAHQVLTGVLTAGQLTSLVAAVLLAYQPLKKLVGVYSDVQYGIAALERIFGVIDEKIPQSEQRVFELATIKNGIELQAVAFAYGKHKVLNDINLTITQGTCIGLIGPSGGGKSTLCDLLMGFISPAEGKILIDGIDASTLSLQSLRSRIGYVGQRTFLFNDTIYNNIAYGCQELTKEKVLQASKDAFVDEFVSHLAEGYETLVGENGTKLSGGQKQRITIARALLRNPDILIFDEATSALDDESEKMILETINHLRGKKTIIIVSHRARMLEHADQIMMVDDKQVRLVQNPSHQTNTVMLAS